MRFAKDLTLLLKRIVIKLLKFSFKWDDGKDNLNVNVNIQTAIISANNQYGTNIRAIPTDLTALISINWWISTLYVDNINLY